MKQTLEQGLNELGLDLTDLQQQQLLTHLEWVKKWNNAYNLTAILQDQAMVRAHTLDSLAVLPHIKGVRFLDMGTGAGFPGLPLAIANPNYQMVLLDAIGKRTRFLHQLCHHLGLKNVTVVHSRVQNYRDECLFDGIMSRAVAKVQGMIDDAHHLLKPQGHYYWLKGQFPSEELEGLVQAYESIELNVPGLSQQRHVIIVDR